jgi:methionyl-tRNA formyltransferase
MPCAFSTIVLDALRSTDLDLVGIVTPDRSPVPGGPISIPRPFFALRQHREDDLDNAPRFAIRSLQDRVVRETLAATRPDLIVVACFPWLLRPDVVSAASIAAINVHPSLLPRWRGPDPLFWTFHAGDTTSGVTIHHLEHEFDTGPIVAQRAIAIEAGESLAELDRRLATIGGELLIELIRSLPAFPDAHRQVSDRATSAPIPDEPARTIETSWTTDRARRFIAGVMASHGPLFYRATDDRVLTITSLEQACEIDLCDGTLRIAAGSAQASSANSQL